MSDPRERFLWVASTCDRERQSENVAWGDRKTQHPIVSDYSLARSGSITSPRPANAPAAVPAGPKPAQAPAEPVKTLVLYDDTGHAVPPLGGAGFLRGGSAAETGVAVGRRGPG